ncbi:MAG TPA: hypothetical protein VK509_09695, partial [Polyangiales bacterium]|nr:hypothetical protein [Polyangiales bacterium]
MSEVLRLRVLRRREALRLALVGLSTPAILSLGASAGLVGCGTGGSDGEELWLRRKDLPSSADHVPDYFTESDDTAIAALGRARLNDVKDVSAFDEIFALLDTVAEADSVEVMSAAVVLDFDQRRIVHVEGWILSRTEADLCALFAVLIG